MIIEIESVYGDSLLYGRKMTLSDIDKVMKDVLNVVSEQEFIEVFCTKSGYEKFDYQEEIRVDYVIDIDTHKVYKPRC